MLTTCTHDPDSMCGDCLESDFTLLYDYAEAQKHPAWDAFNHAMIRKAYGREALNDAWIWFSKGWDERQAQLLADEWT